ncbi:MAG: tetratricopeptide repeat protein [Myxococcales bacterium]|nr:tetratricopeptide repeat protein [Myxococcales bacterium]
MELRLNAVVGVFLLLAWSSLTGVQPVSSLPPASERAQALAELEDAFAHDPTNVELARGLAETYLELRRPGLAIAVLRAGDPSLIEHPVIAHRLARAYEASGRVLDAFATADLALARCARYLGTGDAPSNTPLPRFACDARQHAALSVHHRALERMVRWGVAVPGSDPRTELAYDLAMRRARVASVK